MNKLAIVIPYYNPDFFEETLKSVAAQTDKRFKLYIGNDASPHDPLPLIQKYFPPRNYYYYDYKENLGGKNLALQWERILENVKEDWFQILGDDDVISENFVEEFYNNIEVIDSEKSNVVKYSQRWIDDTGAPISSYSNYPKTLTPIENWENKFINGDRSSLSEHIFRTISYQKYKFKELLLAWGSDDIAILEFSENKPIIFIPKASVEIRISNGNISGRSDNYNQKEIAMHYLEEFFITRYYKVLPKFYIVSKIQNQIKYAFQNSPTDLRINLFKIYLNLGEYKKIFLLPKLYYHLYSKK